MSTAARSRNERTENRFHVQRAKRFMWHIIHLLVSQHGKTSRNYGQDAVEGCYFPRGISGISFSPREIEIFRARRNRRLRISRSLSTSAREPPSMRILPPALVWWPPPLPRFRRSFFITSAAEPLVALVRRLMASDWPLTAVTRTHWTG